MNPLVERMLEIYKNQKFTDEELTKKIDDNKKTASSPEYIDDYIYTIENKFVLGGIVDWQGCHIDENWEKYKEKVGYYERHPDRKESSQAFTKYIITWWKKINREENDEK